MKNPVAIHEGITRFFYRLAFVTALLGMLILQACATQQPEENQKLSLMEKQIRELEDKMDESYHRLSVIQFMVDNHERKLREVDSAAPPQIGRESMHSRETPPTSGASPSRGLEPVTEATIPPTMERSPPPSPGTGNESAPSPHMLYNKALAAYKQADFTSAAADFTKFIEAYPQHELTDNAVYWKGECQYAQKDFQGAIATFKQILTQYPDGGKVPDALLKIGYAFLSVNDKENARVFLKQAVKNYPFSPAGTKAEQMLKKIQ